MGTSGSATRSTRVNFLEGHEDEAPLGFGLAEATSANPVRKILSAIDLTAWLVDLPADDRRMLQLRVAGFTLEETAAKLHVSTSNIFARCKQFGSVLAERAGIWIEPKSETSSGRHARRPRCRARVSARFRK